jgi:5-methylcytosine-specific restriction protein A
MAVFVVLRGLDGVLRLGRYLTIQRLFSAEIRPFTAVKRLFSMLVSCKYCGGVHSRGFLCPRRPADNRAKDKNYIRAFRSGRAWRAKAKAIKARDLYLCAACKDKGRYIFEGLECHHIRPLARCWSDRLNGYNLITLCQECHKAAENGRLNAGYLLDLAEKAENAAIF